MSTSNMSHMAHLPEIAAADVSVLEDKEATYKGSWKAAGGRSAWFMFRRNMDRLLNMCAAHDFKIDQHKLIPSGGASLSPEDFKELQKSLRAEDIFKLIAADPSGNDGTVLACLRDLRRYALLVEAEMVSRGVVRIEHGKGDLKKDLLEGFTLPPGLPSVKLLVQPTPTQVADHGQFLVGSGEPGIINLDLSKLESAAALNDASQLSDDSIASAIIYLGSADTEHLRTVLVPAAREYYDDTKDFYGALATVVGKSRPWVKNEMFRLSYGIGAPIQPARPIQEIGEQIRTELSTKNWEEASLSQAVNYAFPDLGDGVRQDLVGKALDRRPGGGVYGRVAEVSGRTSEEVQDLVLGRLYAAPNGDYNADYDRDAHTRMTQAISHALNCLCLDSALGCSDHILAEMIAPWVLQHLNGLTSGQLLEAGWTIGPHGQAIPPGEIHASSITEISIPVGSNNPFHINDPHHPGTPADGGHHAVQESPVVPRRRDSKRIAELYRRLDQKLHGARRTPEFRYTSLISDGAGNIRASLVLLDKPGQETICTLTEGQTSVVFPFNESILQERLSHLSHLVR